MYTYETRRMEDVAELVACLVGVNTGPSPGATGLRGVVGGGGGGVHDVAHQHHREIP